VQRERHILGIALRIRFDRVAQEEMLWPEGSLAYLDHEGLFGRRLRQVVSQALGKPRTLAAKVRHRGHHRNGVPAGWMSLLVQRQQFAGLHERLFRYRAPQELRDRARDLVSRPAEPRVFGIPGLRQRRRCRLADMLPGPDGGFGIALHQLLHLEKQRGILVPREQPEEHPVRQLERPA
jgi:hypothetical protein